MGAWGPGPGAPVSQTALGPRVGRQYWGRETKPGVMLVPEGKSWAQDLPANQSLGIGGEV